MTSLVQWWMWRTWATALMIQQPLHRKHRSVFWHAVFLACDCVLIGWMPCYCMIVHMIHMFTLSLFQHLQHQLDSQPSQEKLMLAAKARIRRMVQVKKKRTDLSCPDWLRKEWEKGTDKKDEMAHCLQAVNWDKAWFSFLVWIIYDNIW